MVEHVKLGLWGGNGGDHRDIDGHPTRVTKIEIRSCDVVDSLEFDYEDKEGRICTAGPWGGSGGRRDTIEFQPSEILTAIHGTVGPFLGITSLVRSLTFVTNVRTYGPFGLENGTPFSIPCEIGQIVAFYGRSCVYLDAIGVYLMPNLSIGSIGVI